MEINKDGPTNVNSNIQFWNHQQRIYVMICETTPPFT